MSYIDRQIARVRRNLHVTAILLFASVLVLLGVSHRYLQNYLAGPRDITADELAQIRDADAESRYYVRVVGTDFTDSGIYEETVTTRSGVEESRHNSAYYGLLRVGDRALIVKQEHEVLGSNQTSFVGALEPLTDDELRLLRPDSDQLPFKLDTIHFATRANLTLGASAVLVLLALLALWKARVRDDRRRHPIVADLAAYGDPERLAGKLDAQVDSEHDAEAFTTQDFSVFRSGFYRLTILPLDQIVWAYLSRGKATAVLVHTRGGKVRTYGTTAMRGRDYLAQLQVAAPWACVGYTPQLAVAWTKNRPALIAQVDRARQAAGRA